MSNEETRNSINAYQIHTDKEVYNKNNGRAPLFRGKTVIEEEYVVKEKDFRNYLLRNALIYCFEKKKKKIVFLDVCLTNIHIRIIFHFWNLLLFHIEAHENFGA